jgi:hypothetical protein
MTLVNLDLALLAVAAVAAVTLLGFFVGHDAEPAVRLADEPERDRELELAA